jgi:hypothetical protein
MLQVLYRLPQVGIDWEVANSLSVQACLAGQEAYGALLAKEEIEPIGNELPEVPTDEEFSAYFQAHLPAGLSPQDVTEWRAYFLVGWYSRLFCLR